MLGGNRLDRVSELLHHELSSLISRELEWQKGVLVTITRVSVSADLGHAKVWVSVLPYEKAHEALAKLKTATPILQGLLNRKLQMQVVPQIQFFPDEGAEQASKIEELLDEISGGY